MLGVCDGVSKQMANGVEFTDETEKDRKIERDRKRWPSVSLQHIIGLPGLSVSELSTHIPVGRVKC